MKSIHTHIYPGTKTGKHLFTGQYAGQRNSMETKALNITPGKQTREILNRFGRINSEKLLRTQECVTREQQHFLELLPLLFHINHVELPGYISEDTPAGVSLYSPAHPTLKAATQTFPKFKLERRALQIIGIHAIFCMGSSGTIAYTHKSDFDIWIVHADDLTELDRKH